MSYKDDLSFIIKIWLMIKFFPLYCILSKLCILHFRWFRTNCGIRPHDHPVSWRAFFSVQIMPTLGTALHLLGKARLGAVLLQDGAQRTLRSNAQEPTGVHCYEPHRSQSGTFLTNGKFWGIYKVYIRMYMKIINGYNWLIYGNIKWYRTC